MLDGYIDSYTGFIKIFFIFRVPSTSSFNWSSINFKKQSGDSFSIEVEDNLFTLYSPWLIITMLIVYISWSFKFGMDSYNIAKICSEKFGIYNIWYNLEIRPTLTGDYELKKRQEKRPEFIRKIDFIALKPLIIKLSIAICCFANVIICLFISLKLNTMNYCFMDYNASQPKCSHLKQFNLAEEYILAVFLLSTFTFL